VFEEYNKGRNFCSSVCQIKVFCIFFLVCWMKVLFQMNQLFQEYNKGWLFFCHEGRLMIYFKNTTKVEAFLLLWNLFFFKQILVLMYGFFLWSMKVIFQMNDVQVSRWMKCLKNIAKVETFVLLSIRSKYFCICFLVYWMKVLF